MAVNGTNLAPIGATDSFDSWEGNLSLSLASLLANPASISQLIGDLFFTLNNGLTASLSTNSTAIGDYTRIGDITAPAVPTNSDLWSLISSGEAVYLMAGGATTAPCCLIIGSAAYRNVTAGVAENGPPNPSLPGGDTIFARMLTRLGTSTVSSVQMSFAAGGGNAVPVPAAIWLLVSGLIGLIGIGRRKRSGAGGRSSDLVPA